MIKVVCIGEVKRVGNGWMGKKNLGKNIGERVVTMYINRVLQDSSVEYKGVSKEVKLV